MSSLREGAGTTGGGSGLETDCPEVGGKKDTKEN